MNPQPVPEHLTPHDLVSYFRCPHEMALHRRHAETPAPGGSATDELGLHPLRHSPLLAPPAGNVRSVEGRLALDDRDTLVYLDPEDGLPGLFPPERVSLDPRFTTYPRNLTDSALGIAGRPDYVVLRPDGGLVPIEYKATHLFLDYHAVHGRSFDTIQAIAECRLVEASFGIRPRFGWILYGDAEGDGAHEGFVEVPYGNAEEGWLRYALAMIRADSERAPVPGERTCGHCEANRWGRCGYSAHPYAPHRSVSGPIAYS
ncbi:MAG TPA: hypothetical protein VFF67_05460 [Thermoplasmata archaeon]|nr:hypothetical protein [Thermoplasmata archaeon]